MVSFFGIKLGSDRKKDKSKDGAFNDKTSSKAKRGDPDSLRESQYLSNNFSRPQPPSSRPGTSSSMKRSTFFRPFAHPEGSSSMVDLTAPKRRPSIGSLRAVGSDANITSRWRADSVLSSRKMAPPALPKPAGNSRPGTPTRPSTAGAAIRKKSWVNPLDAHSAKEFAVVPSARDSATSTPTGLRSVSNVDNVFEFGFGQATSSGSVVTTVGSGPTLDTTASALSYGYPSPPPSIDSPTLESASAGVKKAAPSMLRRVNTADEPPSPARTPSQERWEAPVIRNVQAKRDTVSSMSFHQPRQRSFVSEGQQSHGHRGQNGDKNGSEGGSSGGGSGSVGPGQRRWERDEESKAVPTKPLTDGFEGNLAAFDFGDEFRRSIWQPVDYMSASRSSGKAAGFPDMCRYNPSPEHETSSLRAESPVVGFTWPTPPSLDQGFPKRVDDALDSSMESISPTTSNTAPEAARIRRTEVTTTDSDHGLVTTPLSPPPRGFSARPRLASSSNIHRAPPAALKFSKSTPNLSLSQSHNNQDAAPPSPFGPPLDQSNTYVRNADAPRPSLHKTNTMEGEFPVTKGLPRGRKPTFSPALQLDGGDSGLPTWADRAASRQSALPAPLSPRPPQQASASPSRPSGDGLSTPTSAVAPRLPSPTFPSLETSISNSSESFALAFESLGLDFSPSHLTSSTALRSVPGPVSPPLASPGMSSLMSGRNSPGACSAVLRVDASKAPPRPAPITLPPSLKTGGHSEARTPTRTEFPAAFI